jgi:hypothetical protein
MVQRRQVSKGDCANLPACLNGKTRDLHAEWSATRARSTALLVRVGSLVIATSAASELDNQALSHKGGAVKGRDDVTGVHGVFVLDEAEAVHELDLCNLTSAMS